MYDFSRSLFCNWEKCLLITSGITRIAIFGGKARQGSTREEDWCKIRGSTRGRGIAPVREG